MLSRGSRRAAWLATRRVVSPRGDTESETLTEIRTVLSVRVWSESALTGREKLKAEFLRVSRSFLRYVELPESRNARTSRRDPAHAPPAF